MMLKAENIEYSYDDGTKALKGINFDIPKGKMVSLIGKNGAGKSTLFLQFNGILRPDKGKIYIDDKELKYDKKSLVECRQKVGIVFQNPDDQIFAPTVEEDVAFGPLNLELSMDEVQERVTKALKRVGMEGYEKKAPHYLSGGQKKRVAIAGILAMKPDLMILDEPTAGLDPAGVQKISKLLKELNEEGMTILISTHNVDLVPTYADYVYVMLDGKIIGNGTPKEVFSKKDLIKKANLKLPIISELFVNLKERNLIDFPDNDYPLTIESAIDDLSKVLK